MSIGRLSLRTLLIGAIALAAVMTLQSPVDAIGEVPIEQWVETEAARAPTEAGDCPAGQGCLEICTSFQGQIHPMGEFACHPIQ